MARVTFQRQTQKGKLVMKRGRCRVSAGRLRRLSVGLVATGEAPVGLYVCSSCHCTGVHAFNVGQHISFCTLIINLF